MLQHFFVLNVERMSEGTEIAIVFRAFTKIMKKESYVQIKFEISLIQTYMTTKIS